VLPALVLLIITPPTELELENPPAMQMLDVSHDAPSHSAALTVGYVLTHSPPLCNTNERRRRIVRRENREKLFELWKVVTTSLQRFTLWIISPRTLFFFLSHPSLPPFTNTPRDCCKM